MIVRDILALDRASVRTRDVNGFLHVAVSNISKAAVNGYLGAEIPDYEKLNLDPQRLYQLLRDPKELEAAASTFNGVPLLNRHIPVVPEKLPEDAIVGSIGNDAEFKVPYLKNSLTVWSAASIAGIETEEQCELSCGYRYVCDLTPGTFKGTPYDGVMRQIRANHVSLVPSGRAGSDVVVGDSQLPVHIIQEITPMAKVTLSRKAAFVKGALAVHLVPKLAQDAKLDFAAILKDVTAKNFTAQKPEIAARLKAATTGKLAQDATLDDVNLLLDKLDNADPMTADDDEIDPNAVTEDADDLDTDGIKNFLKGKISDEDHAKLCAMLGPKVVGDEPPDFPGKPNPGGKMEPLTKQAMDAAIEASAKTAVAAAEAAIVTRLNGARDAERDVRQWVGETAMAHDSAEDWYRGALGLLSVPHQEIKEVAALKAVLHAQPKPGARPANQPMAQDAASANDFAKRYPNAARIKSV